MLPWCAMIQWSCPGDLGNVAHTDVVAREALAAWTWWRHDRSSLQACSHAYNANFPFRRPRDQDGGWREWKTELTVQFQPKSWDRQHVGEKQKLPCSTSSPGGVGYRLPGTSWALICSAMCTPAGVADAITTNTSTSRSMKKNEKAVGSRWQVVQSESRIYKQPSDREYGLAVSPYKRVVDEYRCICSWACISTCHIDPCTTSNKMPIRSNECNRRIWLLYISQWVACVICFVEHCQSCHSGRRFRDVQLAHIARIRGIGDEAGTRETWGSCPTDLLHFLFGSIGSKDQPALAFI